MYKYTKYPLDRLICYNCGSFNVEIISKKGIAYSLKCKNCGRVWVKRVN